LSSGTKDTSLGQLTPSQRQAVFRREGPLLVLAGPGSGKTRVITQRIAALVDYGVAPYQICAITFTNKAAEEMRQRTQALGVSAGAQVSTFHSLCVRLLRRYAGVAGIDRNFSIYDDADQRKCVKQAIAEQRLDATNFPPARMLDAISTLKNRLIGPETFRQQADDFFSQTLAQVYSRYQDILQQCNGLDFDDLLMQAALLVEGNATVATELGERYRFLLIDEYQDTNHAQYRLAKAMVARHGNICATGDPDQSIYRWRGADIRNILAFERDWPDATVIKLQENFRSTPAILQAADKLIACNRNRKEKTLLPTLSHEGKVAVACHEDEAEEANAVAEQVAALLAGGGSARETAVFYRVNAMSRALEEAFILHKVPYQIVRGVEFYNRKEIRDILAYLKILVNPADEIALMRIINTPARGIGKVTVDRTKAYAARSGITLYEALQQADRIGALGAAARQKLGAFARMMRELAKEVSGPVAPLMERVFAASGLKESLGRAGADGQDAQENVSELINAATIYDQQADEPQLVDYLQQIALFSDADAYDATSGRVALMTLHAAKGLEFDTVFIVGLEDGLLPHERGGGNEEEMEEERRLFFVGITRAKTNLTISYARYRTTRGQTLRTVPSQFLYELGQGLTPLGDEDAGPHDEASFSRSSSRPEPKRSQPATRKDPEYVPGQLVRHKKFGLGRVKKYEDMGANSIVVVTFNTGQTKSLLLEYAGLSKVQDR
jgi:DNA helicase-2/ATP-dependent DNA helicase PcrA